MVQRLSPVLSTGLRMVSPEDELGDGIKLEKVEEKAFAPLYLVRLSRIVSIDEAKFKAWAAKRAEHPPAPLRSITAGDVKAEGDQILEWLRQLP